MSKTDFAWIYLSDIGKGSSKLRNGTPTSNITANGYYSYNYLITLSMIFLNEKLYFLYFKQCLSAFDLFFLTEF
jgi:hypothetical protein